MDIKESYTAFADQQYLIRGDLVQVATQVKKLVDSNDSRSLLVFVDQNGLQMDLDLRGDLKHVLAWIESAKNGSSKIATEPAPTPKRAPGRPRLGVVGHEVTLLPRHWQWLKAQPGGASIALRKLVDRARTDNSRLDQVRISKENTFRFMNAIAGNEPGFEEASRALFAGNKNDFYTQTHGWPKDVLDFVSNLASDSWLDESHDSK